MAILVDFSQMTIGACHAFSKELDINNPNKEEAKNIIRHVILSQLKYYNHKYKSTYGKMIICCDGKHYWRREIFSPYKACRKKARAESSLDWQLIFTMMDELIHDLKKHFPYKVIRLDRVECDDIIATLTKYYQTNEMDDDDGFFVSEPQNVMIISSDKDFIQLHQYRNVKQVAPRTKLEIKEENPKLYLHEKLIRGDKGDGIPSILCEDDIFIKGLRAEPLTKKKMEKYMALTPETCDDERIKKHWERNRRLIDFDYIPQDIIENILKEYENKPCGNKMSVFNYLIANRCNQVLKEIDQFF